MPVFRYEAFDLSGERSTGTLEAPDRSEAIRKLTRRGLQPSLVRDQQEEKVQGAGVLSSSRSKEPAPSGRERGADGTPLPLTLKRAQVIQFTEELCDLLAAGLQLEQALHAMENRSGGPLRMLASLLRVRVRDGVPFSLALHQVCPSFGELYCNLAAAGEASGSLVSILDRQGRYLNQMEALQAKVTSALIYPLFIVASGIALGVVFLTYLLPKLAVLIKNTRGKMPAVAEWLMAVSSFLQNWWWLLLAALAAGGLLVHLLLKNPRHVAWWHRAQLSLPIYGPVLRTRFEVQFLETLGNLLHNGLPLHRALELVRRATMNLHLRECLGAVEEAVRDGGSLSRALERSGAARPLVVDMVRVGEQTGELSEALQKAADRFERQLGKTMEHATALIQPVIIVCMAAMVGVMAWMMINVVYSTLDNLRHR